MDQKKRAKHGRRSWRLWTYTLWSILTVATLIYLHVHHLMGRFGFMYFEFLNFGFGLILIFSFIGSIIGLWSIKKKEKNILKDKIGIIGNFIFLILGFIVLYPLVLNHLN
jgi:hypothetical protein